MPTAQLITRVLHFVASITTPLAVYTIAYGVVPFYGPLPPVHARLFDAPQPKPATVRVSLYLNEINEAHFTPIIDPIRDDNPQDHTSMVLTSAEIDVSGTTQRLELTAQHSEVLDFALKVTEAISTSAEHPCVSSALRWAWLQKLATFEILGPLIRGLAVFFLCHNYVMSSIYVACLALILVAGAVLYGLYYKVKDLRQIVMMSQELAVSKAEAGSHTLDFTLNVTNIFLFSEKKIAPIMHVIGRVLQVVGFITTPLTIYTVASTGIVPLYGPLPSYRVPDFAALNLQPMRVVVPINIITVNTTYLTSTSSYNIGNSFPKHTNFVITTSDFNVPNTIYKLELTANGSNILDFAYNVTSALTTTAETLLGAFIRGLAAFFLCHDYVMSTIYVACTTMILAGGAIFYGWIFRDLRQIVTLTRQLSQSEKGVEILATQKSIAEAQTHAARVAKEDTESLYDKIVEELKASQQ